MLPKTRFLSNLLATYKEIMSWFTIAGILYAFMKWNDARHAIELEKLHAEFNNMVDEVKKL